MAGKSSARDVHELLRQVLQGSPETDFDRLALELRALIAGRSHTPAEVLLREGREER
jgi:hypothetical protein